MIDRNVEFPNRFRMTKVEGTDDIYDLIPAPGEVIAPGDTFSKANMLPDSIPALLGLKMVNPQVKDALNVLAHVGNLHVWERVQTYAEEVPAVYSIKLNDPENDVYTGGGDRTSTLKMDVSSSVHADGLSVVMDDPVKTSFTLSAGGALPDAISGKYIDFRSDAYTTNYEYVYYIPPDATITYNNYMLKLNGIQRVTAYKVSDTIPAGTTTDYLTSTDRNAYPDKSAGGGKDAYYTLGDAVTGNFKLGIPDAAEVAFRYYSAPSIVVDDGGSIDFGSDKEQFSIYGYGVSSIDSIKEKVIGKFVMLYSQPSGYGPNIPLNEIVYVPSDAGITTISDQTYYAVLDKYQPVTGHAAIPANTTITYLGQLGGCARIEVGSYVGTGTYGSSNPNSLTFGFEPKVFMFDTSYTLHYGGLSRVIFDLLPTSEYINYGYPFCSSGSDSGWAKKSTDGKTLFWYNSSGSSNQMNYSGETYYYIAIG